MVNPDCFSIDHEQGMQTERDEKLATVSVCMNRSSAEAARHFCQVSLFTPVSEACQANPP